MQSSPDQSTPVAPPPPTAPPHPSPPPRQRGNGQRVAIAITVVVVLAIAAMLGFPRLKGVLQELVSDAGTTDWADFVAYSREGDQQLGDLRVGNFNYINACDVYTADHYEESGLGASAHDVRTTFATRTYGDEDPLRTYKSRCTRGFISMEMEQFSDKAHQGKSLALLKGFEPHEEYAQVLGDSAMYRDDLEILMFEVDNKRVLLTVMDESVQQEHLLTVARAIKGSIEQRAQQPSPVLDYSPESVKVGKFPYRSACELFGPDDYRKLVGVEPDAGLIESEYAERLPRSTEEVTSTCTIHTLPPKTSEVDSARSSGDLFDEDFVDQIVTLDVQQHSSIRWARDFFEPDGAPERIKGADDAYVQVDSGESGPLQVLHVLNDNVHVSLRVDRFGTGGLPVEGDQTADLKTLKGLARIVTRRLD